VVDYVLKRDAEDMVRYLYKNDVKHPYVGKTRLESAEWMLRQGEVRVSEEYEGFPVTANGKYFFEAEVKGTDADAPEESAGRDGDTSFVSASADTFPSEGKALWGTEIGADGLPLPAGAEKPRRKKRVKDVVCE